MAIRVGLQLAQLGPDQEGRGELGWQGAGETCVREVDGCNLGEEGTAPEVAHTGLGPDHTAEVDSRQ